MADVIYTVGPGSGFTANYANFASPDLAIQHIIDFHITGTDNNVEIQIARDTRQPISNPNSEVILETQIDVDSTEGHSALSNEAITLNSYDIDVPTTISDSATFAGGSSLITLWSITTALPSDNEDQNSYKIKNLNFSITNRDNVFNCIEYDTSLATDFLASILIDNCSLNGGRYSFLSNDSCQPLIIGCDFSNFSRGAIYFQSGPGIVIPAIVNNTFHDFKDISDTDCIVISGEDVDSMSIYYNVFYNLNKLTNGTLNIIDTFASNHNTIYNNTFSNITTTSLNPSISYNPSLEDSGTCIYIHGTGTSDSERSDLNTIYNNLAVNCDIAYRGEYCNFSYNDYNWTYNCDINYFGLWNQQNNDQTNIDPMLNNNFLPENHILLTGGLPGVNGYPSYIGARGFRKSTRPVSIQSLMGSPFTGAF
jgi:hypothetical protein